MFYFMRILFISTLFSFAFMACDQIPANNPFDPETSQAQQLQGQLVGRVTLPDQYPSRLLEDVNVTLSKLDEIQDQPNQQQLVSSIDISSSSDETGALKTSGRFTFQDLSEGRYQLQVTLDGFNTVQYSFIMEIGELIDLGTIRLTSIINDNTGDISVGVFGVVKRSLGGEGEHGGILVEAVNTSFSTSSNSEGAFYLSLPPGEHTLRFSTINYQSARLFAIQVDANRLTNIEEELVLQPNPSQARGSVSLQGRLENVPLSNVVVRLLSDVDSNLMNAVQTVSLDDLGRFILDDIPVGPLWLLVSCEGYYEQLRPFVSSVGIVSEVGHFDLQALPVTQGPSESLLQGSAQFSDLSSHQGLQVEIRRNNVLISSLLTDSQGFYGVNVPTQDYILTFTSPFYISQSLEVVWDEEDLRFEVSGAPLSGRDPIVLQPELPSSLSASLYSPLPVIERGAWPEVTQLTLTGERGVFTTQPDEEGDFTFDQLHPGLYVLEVNVTGHLPTSRVFELNIEPILLEEAIRLIPLPPEVPAEIRGRTQLARGDLNQGELATEHSGVIVIARQILEDGQISVDVAGSAVSNTAGEYRITANRQNYQLSFSKGGYVSRVIAIFWSEANLRFEVEENLQRLPLDSYTVVLGQNLGELGDVDVDGVPNGEDNCPNLFNPPSIFGEAQADLDQDGIGDPCDLDQDGDGLNDIEEIGQGLNIRDADTDNDHLGDALEVQMLASSASSNDTDQDGRLDSAEIMPSTRDEAQALDIDFYDDNEDGIISLAEAQAHGLSAADFDEDLILDILESTLTDSDGDGARDQWDGPGPLGDLDGDGFLNGQHNDAGDCIDPVACDPCIDVVDSANLEALAQGNLIPLDSDADGVGDACDLDDDNDGEPDVSDVCRLVSDPQQIDTDLDGRGDACDEDDDNDGLSDEVELAQGTLIANPDSDFDGIVDGNGVFPVDNCPSVANPEQRDQDQDQVGDACDIDDDEDGRVDVNDNCPLQVNPTQANVDGDGFGDACDLDDDNDGVLDPNDNCPVIVNPDQSNHDLDIEGDACDEDDDNDGVLDPDDNCVFIFNPDQRNSQGGVLGDACSLDIDGDGIVDGVDNCLESANSNQSDLDTDGFGDVCDDDADGDGLTTVNDNCPLVFNPSILVTISEGRELITVEQQPDFDLDGLGDACDDDDDNDFILDTVDSCPNIANLNNDVDSDQIDDACDVCIDVFDPLQRDSDEDLIGDACDEDADNDTIIDSLDNCPTRYNPQQIDLDANAVGDACQYRFQNYLSDRDVKDLAIYEQEIWVASESGGFTLWTWSDVEQSYQRRRYTNSEGVPSNRVKHIAIDSVGNLLAITDKGLATHYAASDTWDLEQYMEAPADCRDGQPVIPWGAAIDLDIYRNDDTVYTAFKGVVIRYRGGQLTCWKRGDDLPDLAINGVDVNPYNGDVWVSTNGGAYRYNQQTGWQGFTRPILRSDRVQQVGFDADGRVWILSQENGNSYVILDDDTFEQFSGFPSPQEMSEITESRFGIKTASQDIWYFDDNIPGLVAIDTNGSSPNQNLEFHPLLLDNKGDPLPIGPQGQMLHQGFQLSLLPYQGVDTPVAGGGRNQGPTFQPIGEASFTYYVGPAPQATRSDIDKGQGMWSASIYGVKLNDTLYTTEDGLQANQVRDIAVDALDQVWVGTANGLVHRRLGRFYSYYPGKQVEDNGYRASANQIYAVVIDLENRAWFGTQDGIYYFDGIEIRPVYDENQQRLPPIFDLFVDQKGVLWAGSSQGLYRRTLLNRNQVAFNEAPFEMEFLSLVPDFEPTLTRIKGSADGRIYAASPRGLFVRSPDGKSYQYTYQDGLPDNRVQDIFVVNAFPDPMIWVATDAGLTQYTESLRELDTTESQQSVSQSYPPFTIDHNHHIMWIEVEGGYFEASPSDPSSLPVFLFPFEVSRSEVTMQQWNSLLEQGEVSTEFQHMPQLAVDPQALRNVLPVEMDLPTQAEWELLAQGDRLQHHALYPWKDGFPWSESQACEKSNSTNCIGSPLGTLSAVCAYPLGQTIQGLCDIGGNASEWALGNLGWILVGGGALSTVQQLLLTQRILIDDPQADTVYSPAARGFRLVKRSR